MYYMQYAYTFILFIHICTEPTGFIIAIGSDPDSYKGSQLSLPPADNQWYKGDDGDGGEGTNGKDSADGEVGADDDQLLKTPPPLPPALPPLPQADPHWYKSGDESKGSEAMDICSVQAGSSDDGAENDNDLFSDEDGAGGEKDPEVSSDDGLNESGK